MRIAGPAASVGTVAASSSSTTGPVGGVPPTSTVLTTEPASTSVCVIEYVLENDTVPPGSSPVAADDPGDHAAPAGSAVSPSKESSSVIAVSVTLPEFVTTNSKVISSPTAPSSARVPVLLTEMPASGAIVSEAASSSSTSTPVADVAATSAMFSSSPAST